MDAEKFFRVSDASEYKKAYFDVEANRREIAQQLLEFSEEHKADFIYSPPSLCINDTAENRSTFYSQLTTKRHKTYSGYIQLRANCKLNILWRRRLKERDINPYSQVIWQMVFDCYSASSYCVFDYQGEVYIKYFTEGDITVPEGFIEILGSDFYKYKEAKQSEMK